MSGEVHRPLPNNVSIEQRLKSSLGAPILVVVLRSLNPIST